jgi:hypothetical protein
MLRNVAAGDPWPALYPALLADRLGPDPTFFRVDRLPSSIFLERRHLVGAIERRRTVADPGSGRPHFTGHRLGEPTLFTVPRLDSESFCFERGGADDSLLRRARSRVTGLVFGGVWSVPGPNAAASTPVGRQGAARSTRKNA